VRSRALPRVVVDRSRFGEDFFSVIAVRSSARVMRRAHSRADCVRFCSAGAPPARAAAQLTIPTAPGGRKCASIRYAFLGVHGSNLVGAV